MISAARYTKRFQKDLKRMIQRGKDKQKIKYILGILVEAKSLEKKYKNHKLVGNYKDRYECHIESDWLLIYKLGENEIVFERTGTHSDLFE